MFTPLAGPAAGLTFFETFITCISGGLFAATIFYFGSSYFMKLALRRKIAKIDRLKAKGKTVREPRKFTKSNRWIIRIKHSLGIYGVSWIFPLFLSVPLGTIITAKFYKHQKKTFPLIVMFLIIDCFVITGVAYLFTGVIT